jgi:hypothetical protein
MTDLHRIDRRRHRGPWRFLHMNFSDFVKRFLGWSAPRR